MNAIALNSQLASSVICTLIVSYVFARMSFSYTYKRFNEKYAAGKAQAPSIRSFKSLSKLLFVVSMLLTIIGYWHTYSLIPIFHESMFFRYFGVAMVVIGFAYLQRSFEELGDNYSPLFDAYIPKELVTDGVYSRIRHPIYLFNLFVSFGLAISSGSIVVLACALVGFIFVLRAIYIEEAYLSSKFDQYITYMKSTWRLVPHVY